MDEIVERIATKELFDGKETKNPHGLLLRVGALGYDPPEKVLKHTLDWRTKEVIERKINKDPICRDMDEEEIEEYK